MKKILPFKPADILLPRENHVQWAVIACDQFTSEPAYWKTVAEIADGVPSALKIILPEIYLDENADELIREINRKMDIYMQTQTFREYKNAMVYVERTLPDGRIRRGIVGAIDLEEYDYSPDSTAMIRATEGTVLERIPPRVRIRRDATLELPHVMVLFDDPHKTVIEPLDCAGFEIAYDFDLMLGGGHLKGYFLPETAQRHILDALHNLTGEEDSPLLFAVGDGNHSLATAKTCYELNKTPLSRYALVEIVNIHDEALEFEPIYRAVFHVNPEELREAMAAAFGKDGDWKIEFLSADIHDTFSAKGFPVGQLQDFLDEFLLTHKGVKIDYIHGEESLRRLAAEPDTVGFLFDGMKKSDLFGTIQTGGVLPRKSFSMGEAASKRYYMECRRIKE